MRSHVIRSPARDLLERSRKRAGKIPRCARDDMQAPSAGGNPAPAASLARPMADPLLRLTTVLSDRYRIERELGAGGMATVYLAHDLKHARRVAIKVLRPELSAVIGAERFLREIKTIANLQHPHILGLIDSGEVHGTAYYVMPFVEGESLHDRLTREKQLPIPDGMPDDLFGDGSAGAMRAGEWPVSGQSDSWSPDYQRSRHRPWRCAASSVVVGSAPPQVTSAVGP
jgi:Protein kinase domain